MGLRAWLGAAALLVLSACGSQAPTPGAPGFEGWYQNLAESTTLPRYLWRELAPIAQTEPEGDLVHLRLLDEAHLQVSLYRQARCVARMALEGDWHDGTFFHEQSYYSGLPPLVWGRQTREAQLRPRVDHLQMLLHESSFGMFLIIAGGAPDRDASYRFDAVAAPASRDEGCSPSRASADGYR